ncbi:MAG TPA: CAP domain-containing protein [Rhizomicrobium sp.]|nr:CAP domain-containing protein [Rhizomicrobium sp.]
MVPSRWKSSLMACAILLVTSPVMGSTNPPQVLNPPLALNIPQAADKLPAADTPPAFDQRILAVHNRERLGLGLDPLHWNPALAQSAQQWADYLAATGRFEHAPENSYAPQGENLWAGTKGYYALEARVDAWIREKKFFQPGSFPDNSITGRVEDVGHYTQVVWRATKEVGCAQAASASEDILVCRYAEAGNYRGEQPF